MKKTKIPLILWLLAAFAASAQNTSEILRDSLPEHWSFTPQTTQTLPTEDNWWSHFNDSTLNFLMRKAVDNNYNVAMAVKRIEMARLAIKEAQSGYYPTIGLNGSFTASQSSGALENPVVKSSRSNSFSLGATVNWEVDLFGRIHETAKMKKASYKATRAEYDGVMVSLCANLATAYIQLRTAQRQYEVAQAHIASQENVVRLTEARFEAELADKLDVTQAKIVLYSTQASIPALSSQIRTLANGICVLCGEYPGEELARMLMNPAPLPVFDSTIQVGVPADLLRRRPDIVEAEMTLAENAAAVGVAKKDFLPTLTIDGSIGTQVRKAGDLFGSNSLGYSIGPTLSWTLFDGFARNYRTAEARMQMESAIDNYNLTVLNAMEEADNAIVQHHFALRTIEITGKVMEESRKSLNYAIDLYKSGLTAFSNVVDGQMSWLENENSIVVAQGKSLTTLIAIYQALGGGWSSENQISPEP